MIELYPSEPEYRDAVRSLKLPAIVQLTAKTEAKCTPLDLYASLRSHNREYSYLLESVEKERHHARFSFVGSDPDAVVTVRDHKISFEYRLETPITRHIASSLSEVCDDDDGEIRPEYDVLDALKPIIPDAGFLRRKTFDRQVFLGGAIGYCGYDIVYDCWLDIKRRKSAATPDAQFLITSHTIVFDHLTGEIYIVLTPFVEDLSGEYLTKTYRQAESDAASLISVIEDAENAVVSGRNREGHERRGEMIANTNRDVYEAMVRRAKQHIIDGDIFQVVLSRRYEGVNSYDPVELYRMLREVNPSPYMYLFDFDGVGIVGASPETLFTVHNRKLITNPIAGTCPRGKTDEEDAELAKKLLSDEKEQAEHVMLVDLGRNDVRMVSKPGSVKVEDFMTVRKYSHLQHIESTVTGMLRDDSDAFDATRAIFPAGTLSGAPKIRAMEIIDALEKDARGIYGGGVGYYTWNGDADFAIVIRTIVLDGNRMFIQAGAGIVADSDPTYEYLETERKMAAMMKVIE
ncbi:MAG TPA: anthranilate synthase component I [Methanosarcinales archaeon]|nr:anthranilate synthase component I [Methanosarcinales archaeon]